jgi:putative oxidoreductase
LVDVCLKQNHIGMKTIIQKITAPTPLKNPAADALLAIPRVVAGLLLSIDFGSSKFGMPWSTSENELALFEVASWFPEDVANFGAPFSWAPVFFAWIAAASEAIGGIFLALGFQTRIAAFFIACTMLTAIFFQKWGEGTWSMLPAMGFLWLALYLMVLGSGRFGLDHLIAKRPDGRIPILLILPVFFLTLAAGYGGVTHVTIPPRQAFILGDAENNAFRAKLLNKGVAEVKVKIIRSETKEQTKCFGLSPGGEARVRATKRETVLLINESNTEALVRVKLNKGVQGMSYQKLN